MFFTTNSLLAAACGFATFANAHMLLATPARFSSPAASNSPLDASGSNFPCQNSGGSYSGTATSMELGSTQPLSFTGQATHGGGSCQVSITYDESPTKSSVWKVVTSIEGGCPAQGQAGNMGNTAEAADPYQYNFTLPSDIPSGKATLAWTWFNKIGNREMYMNCAPIELTGSSGSQSNYDALPNMFTANIGNGCTTQDSADVVFPDPGQAVVRLNGATDAFSSPVGSCQATAAAGGSGSGSGGSGATTTAAGSPATQSAKKPSATNPGGVFVTVSAGGSGSAATPSAGSSAAAATPTSSGSASGSGSSSSGGSSNSGSSGSGSTVSGAQTPGSACSTEGQWNCISGSSFQQCASGVWSAVQSMAAGTTCTSGVSTSMNIVASGSKEKKRRALRFSA